MNVSKTTEPWRDHYAHPCAWDQQFAPLSLPAMLEASVNAHPEAPLVEFFGRTYSYAALYDEARRFAAGLVALGVEPGDRVGLYLPNIPTYVPAYYGAMMAGATVVNFSPLYTVRELTDQVVDSGTKLLVTVDLAKLLPGALEVLRSSPLERLVVARFCQLLPRLKGLAYR
ncbi:MAG: AMP-binding protein, partial [Novosphingobium sp.]